MEINLESLTFEEFGNKFETGKRGIGNIIKYELNDNIVNYFLTIFRRWEEGYSGNVKGNNFIVWKNSSSLIVIFGRIVKLSNGEKLQIGAKMNSFFRMMQLLLLSLIAFIMIESGNLSCYALKADRLVFILSLIFVLIPPGVIQIIFWFNKEESINDFKLLLKKKGLLHEKED